MPTLTVCEEGHWKPLEEGEVEYKYMVEYSKSSRARCRRCSEMISKDMVRVGLPIKWKGSASAYGWINSWCHPQCVRTEESNKKQVQALFYGLDNLKAADKKLVLNEVTKAELPEALKPLDPDNETFFNVATSPPPPPVPTPKMMTRELLPFQQEGVAWMLAQENSAIGGGILADEMGMGKTIQTIGLLLEAKAADVKARRKSGPTLVVCPTSAMMQWADEIASFTKEDALRVVVYYGTRTHITKQELEQADVVLSTFPVIEGEWRKVINKLKVVCEYCNRKLLPRTLVVHQKYFCGPEAVRTERLALRETKQSTATEKAMRTLKIKPGRAEDVVDTPAQKTPRKSSMPTMANVYRELMEDANREPLSMFESGKRRRQAEVAKAAAVDMDQPEEEAPLPNTSQPNVTSVSPPAVKGRGRKRKTAEETEPEPKKDVEDVEGGPVKPCTPKATPGMRRSSRLKDTRETIAGSQPSPIDEPEIPGVEEEEQKPAAKKASRGKGGAKVTATHETNAAHASQVAAAKNPLASVRKQPAKPSPGTQRAGKRKKNDADEDDWKPAQEDGSDADFAPCEPLRRSGAKSKSKSKDTSLQDEFDEEEVNWEEMAKQADDEENLDGSMLHTILWERIILDEAHRIKARTTNTAKAVYALRGNKKWCLSGTPLQNRVGELYSLIRFLQMEPFAYYFCNMKGCTCKSLGWRFGPMQRSCLCCGHPSPRHYSHFNKSIINPITRYGYIGDGKQAMLTLKHSVLDQVQLRRTKVGRAADVKLPPLEIQVSCRPLDEKEQDFYESIYKTSCAKFDAYVAKGTILHNYAHIFELLSRLRQATDHPYLVVHSNKPGEAPSTPLPEGKPLPAGEPPEVDPNYYCGLCQDKVELEDSAVSGCQHVFHCTCILEYSQALPEGGKLCCPVCRQALSIDMRPSALPPPMAKAAAKQALAPKSILNKIDLDQYTSSSKVEALVEEVHRMRKSDGKSKAIVFSQYTSMLDIVEWRLQKDGIKTLKLLGSMPVMMRRSVLSAFREDGSVSTILMSLKAGGEGLNLQVASHVFVLEPWWNPAVEMQAIQRAHRIGQTKKVTAVRFVMEGTIEERMLQLQEKKQLVFEGTVDGSSAAMSKLTGEDLQFLFKR